MPRRVPGGNSLAWKCGISQLSAFLTHLALHSALVWLPRYSLLLPDNGQVPKRCKNNGTGSDVQRYGNGCVHPNSFHHACYLKCLS